MLNSEREAKGLMSDPSSWSQGGIKAKAYRQMAVTPDEEVPRHRKARKGRKKHVHKWGEWKLVGEKQRYSWRRRKSGARETVYFQYVKVCKKCGQREDGYTDWPFGPKRLTRYPSYWF